MFSGRGPYGIKFVFMSGFHVYSGDVGNKSQNAIFSLFYIEKPRIFEYEIR